MEKITIFTPTYNRGYIIRKCYESLCRQSNKNFLWLIVDDGSTDNTEDIVNSFINEGIIQIIYRKQRNSGKHIAHNTGVLMCETEMFVCVDSDDYLSDNAVEIIHEEWARVKTDNSLAGIIALRGENIQQSIGTRMPHNIERSSILNLYEKYKFKGDTILIFKTDILKKHLFPVFEGEKFVTEAVIYDQISQEYDMKLVNEILYLCEYLDDGYSKNILSVHKKNPKGYMFYLTQKVENAKGFKDKYKAVAYYVSGCLGMKSIFYYKNCDYKFLKIIAIPKGILIYIKPIIKSILVKYRLVKF